MINHRLTLLLIGVLFLSSCINLIPKHEHKILEIVARDKTIQDKSKEYINKTDYIKTSFLDSNNELTGILVPIPLIIPTGFDFSSKMKGIFRIVIVTTFDKNKVPNKEKYRVTDNCSTYSVLFPLSLSDSEKNKCLKKIYIDEVFLAHKYAELFNKKYQIKLIDTATNKELPKYYDFHYKNVNFDYEFASQNKNMPKEYNKPSVYCQNTNRGGVGLSSINDTRSYNIHRLGVKQAHCYIQYKIDKSKAKNFRLEIHHNKQLIYSAIFDADKTFSGFGFWVMFAPLLLITFS